MNYNFIRNDQEGTIWEIFDGDLIIMDQILKYSFYKDFSVKIIEWKEIFEIDNLKKKICQSFFCKKKQIFVFNL